MAYEMKPNTGSVFVNKNKPKDTSPNVTGSALIGGVEYYMDGWTNTDKNGNKYQSFKFKPKSEAKANNKPRPTQPEPELPEDPDPLPF